MTVFLLILGLAMILFGANYLTEGASDLAKRMRVSDFVVGLTVVAMGTSMPEFVVSFMSALQGKADLAVGNVVGSNLFNTLLILGVTALIAPLKYTRDNLKKDIPFGVLASVVLFVVASDTIIDRASFNVISRSEGLLMLGFFIIFLVYTIYSAQGPRKKASSKTPVQVKRKLWLSLTLVAGGLIGLVWGGNLFLDQAVRIAQHFGLSESVIAVTLLAGGTSLPELFASVVAAYKKKPGLALGNVIGSNIFNIFLVLGASATLTPLATGDIIPADMVALIVSSLLLFVCVYTFKRGALDRTEGIIFILLFVGYILWLIHR
ncbi:MAG: calcium/sodium antiporter [Rikenellaceae bacterium]|nr:calcium/sodium antiporter [Rikenellaceae bacterium]